MGFFILKFYNTDKTNLESYEKFYFLMITISMSLSGYAQE
jgi:hypothetical protein